MGKKKDKDKRPFFDKMRFRYRLSVLDETSLEVKWHFRLSRLSLFLYLCVFIAATFFILAVLIYTTPLRYYLPGYGDEGNRKTVIAEALRADSLQQEIDQQIAYINIIKDVISGNLKAEEIEPLDSFIILDKKDDGKLDPSERERKFTEKFEEEEKYNLSIIDSRTRENAYVFFRPVKGIVAQKFDPFENVYGISIITSANENVLSVLDGTVIYADYSFNNGWVMQIQHEENYISVYKNNIRLLKKPGDIVYAGEIIAMTGSITEKNVHFIFELWHNGNAVNPEDVIIF